MKRLYFKSLYFLAILSSLLALHSCTQTDGPVTPSTPQQKVSGVLQDEDGNLVPGAMIDALDTAGKSIATASTDETGRFEFEIQTGNSPDAIRVTPEDYKPKTVKYADLYKSAGGSTGLIVDAEHEDSCCGKLVVTVTSDNQIVSGATVALRKGDGMKAITTGTSDSNGHVVFNHICAGPYNIRVAKDGYTVFEKGGLKFEECDSASVTATISKKNNHPKEDTCCDGVLTIIPKDSASQEIITGAKVMLKGHNNGKSVSGKTEANGITFRELCEGEYRVIIMREDEYKVEYSLKISCNDSVTDTRILTKRKNEHPNNDSCCNSTLYVIARDSSNNALLEGAKVRIWLNGTQGWAETVVNGAAIFKGLCPGKYVVDITKEGYKHAEFKVELTCNDQEEVTRRLLAEHKEPHDSCCSGNVILQLKDPEGKPIVSAGIKLWLDNKNIIQAKTDADGRVLLTNLCEGKYSIGISANGYNGMEFDFSVACNDTLEFVKKLEKKPSNNTDSCCTASLKVKVFDKMTQALIPGAHVIVKLNDKEIATGKTNDDGWFYLEHMCSPATYVVVIEHEGYVRAQESIKFESCKMQTMTFTLKK